MRILRIAGAATAALLAIVAPAASAAAAPNGSAPPAAGWFPVPTTPEDIPAGLLCDAPTHLEAIVDHVFERILTTNPDGSPRLVQFTGPLVLRLTNNLTGVFTDVDASGSANVVTEEDGSQTWFVVGPALFGFREGHGNLPRGLYRLDGVYRVRISATRELTLTMPHGTQQNVCPLID
jgi:hypothetical protein